MTEEKKKNRQLMIDFLEYDQDFIYALILKLPEALATTGAPLPQLLVELAELVQLVPRGGRAIVITR